jgi:hypothetical protein
MRFEIEKTPLYNDGDTRDILRFAWFPKVVEQPYSKKEFVIWLDKYYETQRYRKHGNVRYSSNTWCVVRNWIS